MSLSCSHFIIETGESRAQGANPGQRGIPRGTGKVQGDSTELGEKKKKKRMICLLHLIPEQSLGGERLGNPSRFVKQPFFFFCECEPRRRHELCS